MTGPRRKAIVIGASAGALEAMSAILPHLPADFPRPILIVVHIPPDKRSVLAELFRAKCRMNVVEVEDKEPICTGTIYFAPPDYHLLVEEDQTMSLSSDEAVLFSRPSIDVLFESAADVYGPDLTAIILTGANHDGARGMAAVIRAGGEAIVQDPTKAFQAAMPEGAIALCPEAKIMSLEGIASYLQRIA